MTPSMRQLGWRDGNAVRLLRNGQEFFPALCRAIDGARSSIHLETYIFEPDEAGRMVLGHLARACERGVRVRVALDGFGCALTHPEVARRIREMGGQCRVYRPEPGWLRRLVPDRNRLRRMHRKTAVIDARLGFVGGINIVDDFLEEGGGGRLDAPRFDYAVELEGPIVADIVHAQDALWVRMGTAGLAARASQWRRERHRLRRIPLPPAAGEVRAAFVLRDNLRFRKTIEGVYLHGIRHARHEILISNAYFFPGRRFRRELSAAAARGVRVRLLLQGRVEYRMQYYATRSLYAQLLAAGIEIHEYMPSLLHAKVAVTDGYATVGSSNLDPFSLLLAREANVVVDDPGFARALQDTLEDAMRAGGRRVEHEAYGRRGLLRRAVDAAAYTLLRMAVALTGQGRQY